MSSNFYYVTFEKQASALLDLKQKATAKCFRSDKSHAARL